MVCTLLLLAGFGGVDFGATAVAGLLVDVAAFVDIVSGAVKSFNGLILMSMLTK